MAKKYGTPDAENPEWTEDDIRTASRIVDVSGPSALLCWAQKLEPPQIMARCDRRKGHTGPHSWEIAELTAKLIS